MRHQLQHLKSDGIFEMWETGNLQKTGAEQWIVQGLAATATLEPLRNLARRGLAARDRPDADQSRAGDAPRRRAHAGVHKQGTLQVEGWLPPILGDGGLGVGYHWSQNAGPLKGVRIAAAAARRLNLPEADELRTGWLDFQRVFDKVRTRAARS